MKKKLKHYTENERIIIETSLNQSMNLTSISKVLDRDISGLSREIKKHLTIKEKNTFNSSNNCKFAKTCKLTNICKNNCNKVCSKCQKCNAKCLEYQKYICPNLLKPPYVCNGCIKLAHCREEKHLYVASEAHKMYLNTLSTSRKGINSSKEELEHINQIVSPLVKQGQSLNLILINHKDELPVKLNSLYNYINLGILDVKNIDLPKKVAYKSRTKNSCETQKEPNYKINRTYDDFLKYCKKYPKANIVEMDTVIGRRNEDKCLLTLLFRSCNFMIAILLPNKTANSVISAFNMLENLLGANKFKKMFNCILTDNGSEFKMPSKLEYNGTFKRCNIFYCNPMNSNQKAKIEKNHEYIRKIIPKGISMNRLTQEDVNLMMSHINSVARKSLDSATPYKLFVEKYGRKVVSLLNHDLISPDEIILNKKLLGNKLH